MRNAVVIAAMLMFVTAEALAEPTQAQREAIRHVEQIEPLVTEMAMKLWHESEIALRETKSAAYLADVLEREGFTLQRGVAGMPTAFVATFKQGGGKPVIGVLAEYYALPSVGNEAVPMQEPRADGNTGGHGCGHNLFGAGSVAAAIALKRTMQQQNIDGTVKLFGCPAEETLIGKVYMARDGVFDGLDACLDWHPGGKTQIGNTASRALNTFEVEFFGKSAHGSGAPWDGRSALDAVELMSIGANYMREHIEPSARLHSVIVHGGDAPNVVPNYAKVWYFVREADRDSVEKNYKWLLDIAKGAALMTQTEYKVKLLTGVHSYNLNRPLQEAAQANLEYVGPPQYTEADHAWAKQLQRELGLKESGYDVKIHPLAKKPGPLEGGSTDVAEVSRLTPTVKVSATSAAAGIPFHSWSATACHGREAAAKSSVVAAKVMAMTGVQMMQDADLLQRAQKAFKESMKDGPYKSPIPADAKPPLPAE